MFRGCLCDMFDWFCVTDVAWFKCIDMGNLFEMIIFAVSRSDGEIL